MSYTRRFRSKFFIHSSLLPLSSTKTQSPKLPEIKGTGSRRGNVWDTTPSRRRINEVSPFHLCYRQFQVRRTTRRTPTYSLRVRVVGNVCVRVRPSDGCADPAVRSGIEYPVSTGRVLPGGRDRKGETV